MERPVSGSSLIAACAALAVVSFLLLSQPAASMEFGADVQIVNNSNRQENPSVAVSAGGTIFVVWQDDRNHAGSTSDIYFAKSTDNGTTFTGITRIDDAASNTDQQTPKIAIDSNGKLHVVWTDARSGSYYKIFYTNSTDNGTTWSTNVQVNASTPNTQAGPDIAIDSNDNLYIAWEDLRSGYHVYMSKSTNGGSSFSASVKLDSSSGQARHPSICAAPNDNLTVAWDDVSCLSEDMIALFQLR